MGSVAVKLCGCSGRLLVSSQHLVEIGVLEAKDVAVVGLV